MFDYLISDNELKEEFLRYGLADKDIIFIKEQIVGPGVIPKDISQSPEDISQSPEDISQVPVRRREPSSHQSRIIGAPNSSLGPSYFPGGMALCRPTRRKELSL